MRLELKQKGDLWVANIYSDTGYLIEGRQETEKTDALYSLLNALNGQRDDLDEAINVVAAEMEKSED
jgi:hypothetical protein